MASLFLSLLLTAQSADPQAFNRRATLDLLGRLPTADEEALPEEAPQG